MEKNIESEEILGRNESWWRHNDVILSEFNLIKILRFDEQRWRKIIYIKIILNIRSRYTRRNWANLSPFTAHWTDSGCRLGHLWIYFYKERRSWLKWTFKRIILFCYIWCWVNGVQNSCLYIYKGMKIFSELGFSNACRFCPSHFLKVWLVKKDSKFSIFSNDNSFQVDTSCYRVEIITFLHRNQFSRKFMVLSKKVFFKTNVF